MLTAKRVERTKKPGRYRDSGGIRGLLLQISANGARVGSCDISATGASARPGSGLRVRVLIERGARASAAGAPAPGR